MLKSLPQPMIIISNSLPKSASTLLFRYQQDLVEMCLPRNGQIIFLQEIKKGEIDGFGGGFIRRFDLGSTKRMLNIIRQHGTIVTKVHTSVSPMEQALIQRGYVKATYIHRDPRDAILSAMNHCKSSRGTHLPLFQNFTSVVDSIPHIRHDIQGALKSVESGQVYPLRYTDLVLNPEESLLRVSAFLGIPATTNEIATIIRKRKEEQKLGMHNFNVGKLTRFREEMTLEEIALCNSELGDEITRLGYEL